MQRTVMVDEWPMVGEWRTIVCDEKEWNRAWQPFRERARVESETESNPKVENFQTNSL
jgi:hypothetical protein